MKTADFSETIAASDLKVSWSRHPIEYMKILGGSPSRKILRFNTIVFRKDKWGIILKVIIRT